MISRILVPTDFSKVANNALQYALKFAETVQSEIFLLHVNNIPVADAYFTAKTYLPYLKELEKNAEEEFEKLNKRFYKNTAIKFQTATVTGDIYDKISSFSKKKKIDLVIMGTTGATGLNEVLFGSTAASMVGKSYTPILVIPPSAKYEGFKHIVYATDYNEPEFPSVSRIIYLAQLYKAKVTVLHARSEADAYFDSKHNFFVKNKKTISYKSWKMIDVEEKNPTQAVNHFIEKSDADLLVLARHNRSFFDRTFHRSMSKRMAYHTHIPLLVLTEEDKQGRTKML